MKKFKLIYISFPAIILALILGTCDNNSSGKGGVLKIVNKTEKEISACYSTGNDPSPAQEAADKSRTKKIIKINGSNEWSFSEDTEVNWYWIVNEPGADEKKGSVSIKKSKIETIDAVINEEN